MLNEEIGTTDDELDQSIENGKLSKAQVYKY